MAGVVTLHAAGSQSYYLGENISFSGTNTASGTTYLFITGPNLWPQGSRLNDPLLDPRMTSTAFRPDTGVTNAAVVDLNPATFQQVAVAGNSWSWKWGTATWALDPGTYTIYAASDPRDLLHLSSSMHAILSIVLKEPFVSASLSSSTINPGDPLTITGTAEGSPMPGVAIWILGENYATRSTEMVLPDTSFSYTVPTTGLAPGLYKVIVQHPMQNQQFDIAMCTAAGATNQVCNLQQGSVVGGTQIFTLLGMGSLENPDALNALLKAMDDPYKDDTYTKLSFTVAGSPPPPPTSSNAAVTILAAGASPYYIGENISFSGTNTASGTTYLFITGPNLWPQGSRLNDPLLDPRRMSTTFRADTGVTNAAVIDLNPATFQQVAVAGNSWSWKWGTATWALDPGTYTIYAENTSHDLPNIGTNNFNWTSITLNKPFVSASLSSSTINPGDPLTITGTAEGSPMPGVAIWILGENYATRSTEMVLPDTSFSYTVPTTGLAPGLYKVIVQHPMQNQQFDIAMCTAAGATNQVCNLQQGSVVGGTQIFTLLGAGSLKSGGAYTALKTALNDPFNDDTFTELAFQIGFPPTPTSTPIPPSNPDGGSSGDNGEPAPASQPAPEPQQPPAQLPQQPEPEPQQPLEPLAPLTPAEQPVEGLTGVTVTESYPVGFEGLSFNADGQNSVSLDISAAEQAGATVTTFFDRVEVYQHGSPGVRITFFFDNYNQTSKVISGTAKRAEFETDPLTINVSSGKVAGSVHAVLTSISQPVKIENSITGNFTVSTADQFRTVMAQNNQSVTGFAYIMKFQRGELTSTGAANVTLTVPPSWVDQHGGKDAVKIARISDSTGTTELINTVFTGVDSGGNMVFRGDSPNGTSIFGLLTAKATAAKQMEEPNVTIQPLQKPAVTTEIGMFAWLLGIIQHNPVVLVIVIAVIGVIAYIGWWKRRIRY